MQRIIPRFTGNFSNLDIFLLVEFQFTITPAPRPIPGDFHPVIQIIKILFPNDVSNLSIAEGHR